MIKQISIKSENFFNQFEEFKIVCKVCGNRNIDMDIFYEDQLLPVRRSIVLNCKDCGTIEERFFNNLLKQGVSK